MRVRLRPFFSYYGAKWNLSRYYPEPRHNTIIEPFAGSAGYSLLYHSSHDILLYDNDAVIVTLWNYLINATRSDILALPIEFDSTDGLDIPIGAKYLLGFWIARSRATPAISKSAWMRTGVYTTSFWSKEKRSRVASQLEYIRHWRCELADYTEIQNEQATWFIDPPYQDQGDHYRNSALDYAKLADWTRERNGQVIVCEAGESNWLPFTPFKMIRGTAEGGKRMTQEVIYHRVRKPNQRRVGV